MQTVLLVLLLLCSILSSTNAAAPLCNYAGCESCSYKDVCVLCQKGWSFEDQTHNCLPCDPGCDICYFTPINSQQWRSTCKGSCQNGCLECSISYQCTKCPRGTALFQGQCISCGDSCSKCEVFQEAWAGELKLNKCTGYCGGGCNSCSEDALACDSCDKGYVLVEGKCWPCPTGCRNCIAPQRDMFYRGWGTSCIDGTYHDPEDNPTPSPTPTPTPTPSNDNVPTTNNSSSGGIAVQVLIIVGLISFVVAAFFVIKRNSKSQGANVQQDYTQPMAAEKQRQAALNIPASNYQYQAPQTYHQGYPQGNYQGYPQGNYQGYPQANQPTQL